MMTISSYLTESLGPEAKSVYIKAYLRGTSESLIVYDIVLKPSAKF